MEKEEKRRVKGWIELARNSCCQGPDIYGNLATGLLGRIEEK